MTSRADEAAAMVVRRALVVILALLAVTAEARMPRMVRMRMEGYIGPPPEGRHEQADLVLRCPSTDVRFQVTKATVVSSSLLPSHVFDRVKPYRPNFYLRGPDTLLAPFCAAAGDTRWRLDGAWRPGTHDFQLGGVDPIHETPTAPPAR
jgi:hypothetical protein